MEIWERVKKDLQIAMKEGSKIFKKGSSNFTVRARNMAKKGTTTMTVEARRLGEIGRLRYEVYRLAQKTHTQYADLGEAIAGQLSKDAGDLKVNQSIKLSPKLKGLIGDVKEAQSQINKMESKIASLAKKKAKG